MSATTLNTPPSDTPLTDEECKRTDGDYYLEGFVDSEFARDLERHFRTCDLERVKLWALLREAHQFLTAQAYTREEMEEFMRRLDAQLGIRSDT